MSAEKPILFTGPMVKAILEGEKTQTRRVVRPQAPDGATSGGRIYGGQSDGVWWWLNGDPTDTKTWGVLGDNFRCPYGKPGDRLWVRETFWHYGSWVSWTKKGSLKMGRRFVPYYRNQYDQAQGLRFNGPGAQFSFTPPESGGPDWVKRPSIFMPKWACRLRLEVVAIRVEQVQDISEDDAKAEGVRGDEHPWADQPAAAMCFPHIWDPLNAKRGHGWDTNPWVWVVEFKKLDGHTEKGHPGDGSIPA